MSESVDFVYMTAGICVRDDVAGSEKSSSSGAQHNQDHHLTVVGDHKTKHFIMYPHSIVSIQPLLYTVYSQEM